MSCFIVFNPSPWQLSKNILLYVFFVWSTRREIITVRGQSYFSRLPKYWPPSPSTPGECVLPLQQRRGVHTRRAERGMGWGSIFWKTREIGLPSYSNNLSTDLRLVLCWKLVNDLSEADVSAEEAGEEASREDEEVLRAPHPEPQPTVALPVACRILKINICVS